MAATTVTKPEKKVDKSSAYLALAKAKRDKDLPAIEAAETRINELKK